MIDYRVLIGLAAVVLGVIGYIPYYRDTLRGTTKPHPFTWMGFALLNAITFIAQVVTGAGPGAWVTGITAIATAGIAALSFSKGEKKITTFDWACFVGALSGIVFWKLTKNPLSAVLIVTAADLLAFAPTFRKAYINPDQETAMLYALSVLKYGLSLAALKNYVLITVFFPAAIMIANLLIVLLLVIRRWRFK
jgi:hypothetical protein